MPASDFASNDPAFSLQQVAPCARILDGMRKSSAMVMRLPGSLDSLAPAADRVDALLESFRFAFDYDPPSDVFPFDPATGGGGPA